jgi:tetratricopeptide (TPR) repeat protein
MFPSRSARGLPLLTLGMFAAGLVCVPVLRAQPSSSKVVEDLRCYTVTVLTYDEKDSPDAVGCGFFIGGQGDIVTSRHVIKESYRVEVKTSDGSVWPAREVVAEDKQADLIRLSTDVPQKDVHPMPIAAEPPKLGDYAAVIGPQDSEKEDNRHALEGTVTAVREIRGFGTILEISAPVSPGFSGSPVSDIGGEVIGITTFQLTGEDTVNFAVSSQRLFELSGTNEGEGDGECGDNGLNAVSVEGTPVLNKEKGFRPLSITEWEAERESREKSSEDELYLKGINLMCSENWSAALECFESVVRESPMHVLAYPMIGYCNLRLERWDKAAEAYYQTLLIDPQDATSYYDMALAYGRLGRWVEAMSSYKQAIRLDSTNTDAYCGLGTAYVNLNRWEDARRCFEKAVELSPGLPTPHYGLGLTCMALDDMNTAWREYHTLKNIDEAMAEDLYKRMTE